MCEPLQTGRLRAGRCRSRSAAAAPGRSPRPPPRNRQSTAPARTSATISLRNIHLRANQSTDYVQPGRDVELIFVAANNSPDEDDKLVSITSDIGTVTLTGDSSVPATARSSSARPTGRRAAWRASRRADAVEANVKLTKPITNGLTYDFTFNFERAGRAPSRCRSRRASRLGARRPSKPARPEGGGHRRGH